MRIPDVLEIPDPYFVRDFFGTRSHNTRSGPEESTANVLIRYGKDAANLPENKRPVRRIAVSNIQTANKP